MLMVNDIRDPQRASSSVPDDDNKEVVFTPPEVIAEQEEVIDMADASLAAKNINTNPNKSIPKSAAWLTGIKQLPSKLKTWWHTRSKKQKIIIASIAALVVVLIVAGVIWLLQKSESAPAAPVVVKKAEVKKEPPKPTTEASRLTGLPVSPESNLLPVTGVIIENSPDARPQSGLTEAGIVFEAIAEGGITRFLTLFQEARPDYVGPVRSVRPYYLQWLGGFDAAIAHVGGSPAALAKIRSDGIKDLDQSFNGGSYQRVSQRYAPHNVYTNLGTLISLSKDKGFTSSNFTSIARKAEKPLPAPTAKVINLAISSALYNVNYTYDPTTNSYARNQAGIAHKDERSGKQISPKVVVAIVLAQGIDPDGVHTSYGTIGTGKAYIFQDGGVTLANWTKPSDKEQIRFIDDASAPININAGQTWITAVGSAGAVTFSP